MNKLVYLKVFVLFVALAGVIYTITHLSADKVQTGMVNMGLAPTSGGQASPTTAGAPSAAGSGASGASANETINLCHTRVHAIVWPDGRKVQESPGAMKARWQAFNLDPVDIGSMDMEKWLSLYCEVQAAKRDAANASAGPVEFKPYVTYEYIDGTKEALSRADDGTYRFAGQTFASPQLDKAFSELIALAGLTPQGP